MGLSPAQRKFEDMWHIKSFIEDLIYEDETLTDGQQANVNETIDANEELIIKALNELADAIIAEIKSKED